MEPFRPVAVLPAKWKIHCYAGEWEPAAGADVRWSPDGSRLAAIGKTRLWSVNADGSDARELFSATGHDSLLIRGWSSDGRYIVVSVDPDSSASLAADGLSLTFVPADGGHA